FSRRRWYYSERDQPTQRIKQFRQVDEPIPGFRVRQRRRRDVGSKTTFQVEEQMGRYVLDLKHYIKML
ncbi:MAG: hypothetical protein MUO85_08545, partial [candidate division Zixibacteria bacterium]|nr:hypothetical protein [candidate division Zixibacteria bacterium]